VSQQALIYLVEDDADITELVRGELNRYGHQVRCFRTGAQLTNALRQQPPRVCIVDLGLPDIDGLELVRHLTTREDVGVIIISGRDSLPDRVLGLELGADDYISKPFDPRELVARTNSIVRRLEKNARLQTSTFRPDKDSPSVACFANWQLDCATLTLRKDNGTEFVLSAGEMDLLVRLLKYPRQILSRDQLLKHHDEAFDRSIDVRMSRIRKKIEDDPKSPRLIKTIYGMGYMLTSDVQWRAM
jgi:DNA-binding response OmpR family regulator